MSGIETKIISLELQLDHLLNSHHQLGLENQSLRQKLTKLTQERAHLLEKNQQATVKIKRILAQLKKEVV